MTDAAHMFSDFGTFGVSMLALYIAKKDAKLIKEHLDFIVLVSVFACVTNCIRPGKIQT